jgi:phage terminase large subunit
LVAVKSVTIKPCSPKLKVLYEKHRFKILKGGRGSAKSWGVAEALVHYTNTYKTRVLCCREVQKSIKESAKKLIEDTIWRYGLQDSYEILGSEIRHKVTGSIFIFEGLKNDPKKIKSLEGVHIAWVEEAESVSEESWRNLIPTIRTGGSEIWVSFNPRYVTDATWDFIENPRPDTAIITMNFNDNPFFGEELEKERLFDKAQSEKNQDKIYDHIWLGVPMGEEYNTLITPYLIEQSQNRIPMGTDERKIAGFDVSRYGGDFSEFVVRQGNTIIYENSVKGMDTLELADWGKEQVFASGCEVLVVDSAGSAGVFDNIKGPLSEVCDVYDFNGAYGADETKYLNQRVETWFKLKAWIADTGQLPKNKKVSQLSTITYFYNNQNKIQLLGKEEMRRKGIHSPDWGDALSMTFYADIKRVVEKTRTRPRRSRGFAG